MAEIIPLETYAILNNVEDSILKLNPLLNDFQFVKISFSELEKQFQNLFYKEVQSFPMTVQYGEEMLDGDILNSIMKGDLFSQMDIHRLKYVVFLKSNQEGQKIVDEKHIKEPDHLHILDKTREFLTDLIFKLRLLKKGDINWTLVFQLEKNESRFVTMRLQRQRSSVQQQRFLIDDSDINCFAQILFADLKKSEHFEIAFKSFEISYEVSDLKLRYIGLMTALENIFNSSSIQIAHTLSRHLALILSYNKPSFELRYKRIKHLYAVRNDLVHGSSREIDFDIIYELQDLVRQALKYVSLNKISKNDLFTELNSKGF